MTQSSLIARIATVALGLTITALLGSAACEDQHARASVKPVANDDRHIDSADFHDVSDDVAHYRQLDDSAAITSSHLESTVFAYEIITPRSGSLTVRLTGRYRGVEDVIDLSPKTRTRDDESVIRPDDPKEYVSTIVRVEFTPTTGKDLASSILQDLLKPEELAGLREIVPDLDSRAVMTVEYGISHHEGTGSSTSWNESYTNPGQYELIVSANRVATQTPSNDAAANEYETALPEKLEHLGDYYLAKWEWDSQKPGHRPSSLEIHPSFENGVISVNGTEIECQDYPLPLFELSFRWSKTPSGNEITSFNGWLDEARTHSKARSERGDPNDDNG